MFTRKTLLFLDELSRNNNRKWFNAHKSDYEDLVRSPALAYIEAMASPLHKISPHFLANPKKTGGSLMRVYRDTRFSKDKTPYKTNIGIQFRHARGRDVHAPGFYLHIEPTNVFIGAGIWKPDSPTLKAVRALIDDNPKEWQKTKAKVCKRGGYTLEGESLKKPPRGYTDTHPCIDDLKRKDFVAILNRPPSSISKKTFVADTSALFATVAPLVEFICTANDLEF